MIYACGLLSTPRPLCVKGGGFAVGKLGGIVNQEIRKKTVTRFLASISPSVKTGVLPAPSSEGAKGRNPKYVTMARNLMQFMSLRYSLRIPPSKRDCRAVRQPPAVYPVGILFKDLSEDRLFTDRYMVCVKFLCALFPVCAVPACKLCKNVIIGLRFDDSDKVCGFEFFLICRAVRVKS